MTELLNKSGTMHAGSTTYKYNIIQEYTFDFKFRIYDEGGRMIESSRGYGGEEHALNAIKEFIEKREKGTILKRLFKKRK